MLPALIGQFVVILKDSALGYIISFNELLFFARTYSSPNGNVLQALIVAAAIFILINFTLSKIAVLVSSRLSSRVKREKNTPANQAAAIVGAPAGLDVPAPKDPADPKASQLRTKKSPYRLSQYGAEIFLLLQKPTGPVRPLAQPGAQGLQAFADSLLWHMLIIAVRQQGIARSEVHCRN